MKPALRSKPKITATLGDCEIYVMNMLLRGSNKR